MATPNPNDISLPSASTNNLDRPFTLEIVLDIPNMENQGHPQHPHHPRNRPPLENAPYQGNSLIS